MKKLFAVIACFAVAGFSLQNLHSEEADAKKTDDVKLSCPVSGKPAIKDHAVDYKGGKVYLCCPGCPAPFKKDTAKYAVKANQQLVASGQYELVKCPLSGGKLNPETVVEVGGVKVSFCCNNCKGAVEGEKDAEAQLALVFSDKAFEKGFKLKKGKTATKKKKRKRD